MQETKEELIKLLMQTEADREKAREKGLFGTELVFSRQIERLKNLLRKMGVSIQEEKAKMTKG